MATSLAGGGQLDILLFAAEVATSHDIDPDGAVGHALCLRRRSRSAGHRQRDDRRLRGVQFTRRPGLLPGTPTHPGTGQAAATQWLNRLRALAHRTCVAPLPYAQADLDALQRVNDPGLSAIATNSVGGIVDRILDAPSTRGPRSCPTAR